MGFMSHMQPDGCSENKGTKRLFHHYLFDTHLRISLRRARVIFLFVRYRMWSWCVSFGGEPDVSESPLHRKRMTSRTIKT